MTWITLQTNKAKRMWEKVAGVTPDGRVLVALEFGGPRNAVFMTACFMGESMMGYKGVTCVDIDFHIRNAQDAETIDFFQRFKQLILHRVLEHA